MERTGRVCAFCGENPPTAGKKKLVNAGAEKVTVVQLDCCTNCATRTDVQWVNSTWPMKYLNLTAKQRRVINNFMSSCGSYSDHVNAINWGMDAQMYNFPSEMWTFSIIKDLYQKHGLIPTDYQVGKYPTGGKPGTGHHPDCQCNKCTGTYFGHGQPGSF